MGIVRYTQGGTADNVVEKGIETLRALQGKGYKVRDIKNYWTMKDSPYKGINVKVESPDGQRFEMQFHTPHNAEGKEEIQKYYELEREEKNPKKKKEYHDKMMELSTKYEPIKGYEGFNMDALKGSESVSSGSGGVSGVRKKVDSYRGKPEGTYDFRTGKAKEYSKGYSVTFHQNEANEKGGYKSHMGRYTDKEYDDLTNKVASEYGADVNVGVFDDEPEISFHTNSKRDAYKLMVKHNQHSIWDWKRGKIIVNKSYDKTKNPMRGD